MIELFNITFFSILLFSLIKNKQAKALIFYKIIRIGIKLLYKISMYASLNDLNSFLQGNMPHITVVWTTL